MAARRVGALAWRDGPGVLRRPPALPRRRRRTARPRDPVLGSVIASVSERTARELADGHDSWAEVGAPFDRWWLVVRDDAGAVVSAAMRTAPFKPYPTFAMPMSDDAARALAAALHERGELLGGANGALPGAGVLAAADGRADRWRARDRQGDPAVGGHLGRGPAGAGGPAAAGHGGRRRARAGVVRGLPRRGRRAGRARARPRERRAQHPRQRPGPHQGGRRVAVGAARRHDRAPDGRRPAVVRRRRGSVRSTRRGSSAGAASRPTSWAS